MKTKKSIFLMSILFIIIGLQTSLSKASHYLPVTDEERVTDEQITISQNWRLTLTSNDQDQVQSFIDNGAHVNQHYNYIDIASSPLSYAARHNLHISAQVLIDNGANVNNQNRRRETPLHDAVNSLNGGSAIVQVLLNNHADTTIRNNYSQTALDIARINKDFNLSNIDTKETDDAILNLLQAHENSLQSNLNSKSDIGSLIETITAVVTYYLFSRK